LLSSGTEFGVGPAVDLAQGKLPAVLRRLERPLLGRGPQRRRPDPWPRIRGRQEQRSQLRDPGRRWRLLPRRPVGQYYHLLITNPELLATEQNSEVGVLHAP